MQAWSGPVKARMEWLTDQEFNARGARLADSRKTSRALHLDANGRDRVAAFSQPVFEVRHELAQLGSDRRVRSQERPAQLVEWPGLDAGPQRGRQQWRNHC